MRIFHGGHPSGSVASDLAGSHKCTWPPRATITFSGRSAPGRLTLYMETGGVAVGNVQLAPATLVPGLETRRPTELKQMAVGPPVTVTPDPMAETSAAWMNSGSSPAAIDGMVATAQ